MRQGARAEHMGDLEDTSAWVLAYPLLHDVGT